MKSFTLEAQDISKAYSEGKQVLKEINFTLKNREIIGITGENGSGKSTLMKIIADTLEPDSGKMILSLNGNSINGNEYKKHFGFVGPYLKLYDEFNPIELIKIVTRFRNVFYDEKYAEELFRQFDIHRRRFQPVKTFSSGMKQRMKYVLALIHNPEILLLDEPSANLDKGGIETVGNLIENRISLGGSVIIATNESREAELCNSVINLSEI